MKRLCHTCHELGGCWDAPRLVHSAQWWVGACDWCGVVTSLVQCYGYDFRGVPTAG